MTLTMINRQIAQTRKFLDRATTEVQVQLLKDTLRDLEAERAKLISNL